MTRIDFAFGAPDRLRMACQVVRKQFLAGQRLVVYCKDGSRLAAFDRMLWAFDDTAFIPHVLANDPLAPETPVVLTAGDPQQAAQAAQPNAGADAPALWLLNLDNDSPPGFDTFERVLEIVSDDPDDKQAARQRWRTYQNAGHTPQSHDLSRQQAGG
ncbi:DNA polymerase III subunit chi [Achromobacter sp. LC458]|uniref:DNA polymerase III subunit chi n=1 Tax=Achromobacter spanius TaxID=217203 RepID=A0A2S5GUQ1_9BURK|nr:MULTISPECIES: DNA polymerase III subunit chi [Achromobacter]AYD63536.1 DNA polymerase III subunit chi [Achromobacter sp. B7]MDX3985570.1 DNA polymerase III subunit chi [Achromobacter sp.]PPA76654.1 DNA polymerase III subunit chi [Achromobacter spanius]QYJ22909.1 DNA polymerase III subunit chi [Achromobacter sp. ES-001]TRM54818.1 DNA polymerase III subunit chi [Achromobacter sp. LC458]